MPVSYTHLLQVILEYLLRERNMRIMPVRNYLVFYVLTHNDLTVTVMRITVSYTHLQKELNLTNRKISN